MKKILAGMALTAALAVGAIMPHTAPSAGTDGRTWASSGTDGRTWAAPAKHWYDGPSTAIMPHT